MCEQAPVHRFSPLLQADRLPASAHQHTRYKTLPAPPPAAQPVQNSPNTPKKALFSTFYPSRENFLPHPAPRRPAGRTLYRAQCQTRYKTPPTRPRQQPTRYKTLPAPRSTAVPRKSSSSTPKNGVIRLFRACRANFFALTPTSGRAGRTYSRRGLDRTR